MKAGWEVKTLGDAFQTVTGSTPPKARKDYYGNDVPLVKPPELTDSLVSDAVDGLTSEGGKVARIAPAGSILVSCIGNLGKIGLAARNLAFNQQINAIFPNNTKAISEFMFYQVLSPQFKSQIEALATGTTVPIVNKSRFNSITVNLPPLEEQKRIVSILDEAFKGLDRARENAEANLKSAGELFSEAIRLNLRERDNWVSAKLSKCFRLKSGDNLTSKSMVSGPFEVYGGNGVAGKHNASNLSGDNVIVGRVGALCGRAKCISDDIWLTDNAFKVVDYKYDFEPRFLARLLNFLNLGSLARQAAQPVISNSSLKDLILQFPKERSKQTAIADNLDKYEFKIDTARGHYQTKLQDISDLRQSLLQKAFSGELT